jgi:F420-non-reducing hydrogenase large subunit
MIAETEAGVKPKTRRVVIDPVTRLEGHGKIEILLDERGEVSKAYYQIPELRGFEIFTHGRPAEEMPQITSRICGVCPTAHHMAATKALDALYSVEPPTTARRIRELIYNAFMLEDHALHVYVLGGPDFIVGPDAPKEARNILGVIQKVGVDAGKRVIAMRRRLREFMTHVGGKVVHPVFGLPGGVAKGIGVDELPGLRALAADGLDFARFTLDLFRELVLKNDAYVRMIMSETYTHRTSYMGLVGAGDRVDFYDGDVRVVGPDGREVVRFRPAEYIKHVAERVEPWSFVKFCYLKEKGWTGFEEGEKSGVYAVAPLARLNVAEGMATPEAQRAYEEYLSVLGGKPVHYTLANHWARVVEMVQAAEKMVELVGDPLLVGKEIRVVPTAVPVSGVGIVEAPRGTLIHHYETDERGLITRANLVVATQHNAARIAMGVEKAARDLIHGGVVTDGLLNRIEMAFRAYDPCNACATHTLPGEMPLAVTIRDAGGGVLCELRRKGGGTRVAGSGWFEVPAG